MSKTPVSVGLSEENLAWIDAHYNNRSAFINDLITEYRTGASEREDAIARYRLRQLESEIASQETQLEMLEEQRAEIRQRVMTEEERRTEIIDEAAEKLDVPADPENLAIKTWAEKANMTPEEFAEAYKEARE